MGTNNLFFRSVRNFGKAAGKPKAKGKRIPKDPNAPKRGHGNPFILFKIQEMKNINGATFAERARACASQWKNLDAHKKSQFQKEADKNKQEFKKYNPAKWEKKLRKNPKPPRLGYFLFVKEAWPVAKEQNPQAKFLDVSKMVAAKWSSFGEPKKQAYRDRAATNYKSWRT